MSCHISTSHEVERRPELREQLETQDTNYGEDAMLGPRPKVWGEQLTASAPSDDGSPAFV
jgi:hypothetical protein